MGLVSAKLQIHISLKVGVVYKIHAPEIITTKEPHYFIVIAIDDEENFLLMCTTKIDTIEKYFISRDISQETIATLTPSSQNGLTKISYIDCNKAFMIPKTQLIKKLENKELSLVGDISSEEYQILRYSILESEVINVPEYLLPKNI